jgi:hypothetical protein
MHLGKLDLLKQNAAKFLTTCKIWATDLKLLNGDLFQCAQN